MRAAVILAKGHVEVATVDDPTPKPDEVVLQVAATGICGTDLHILQAEHAPSLPLIPGHEVSGTVVALGSDVTTLRVGDRVALDPNLACRSCHYCRIGRTNLCDNYAAIGVTTAGGAADLVAVPAPTCVVLPEHVALEDAALIEPLSCAVRAYDVLRAQLGARVLIYGAGTMGLMLLELAKRIGTTAVDVVDINADKLAIASSLGCSAAAANAAELDRPQGWDIVIDATGNPKAIQDALERVATGGTYLQFGVSSPDTTATVNPYDIYRREITITGSMAILNSFSRAADLFATGVLDSSVFITRRASLEEYPDAIAKFASGEGLKTLVVPS